MPVSQCAMRVAGRTAQPQERKQLLIVSKSLAPSASLRQFSSRPVPSFFLPVNFLALRQGEAPVFLPTVAILLADVTTMKPRLGPANGLPWRSAQSATGGSSCESIDPVAFGFVPNTFAKDNSRFRVSWSHLSIFSLWLPGLRLLSHDTRC